ncbi:MAG: MATE family efflux transporter [Roseburia sp.]|nr:MATE family efflux transporter [Roseburia sp.]
MKQYEQDMTQGSLWKQIWKYSLPLMFTNVLQVVFNLADIAVVGQFGGSGALGSVGSTTILITLFTGLLIGLAGGVNVLVAQARGEKNPEKTRKTVHTAAVICMIGGILVAVFGILFARTMLAAMNTKPELIDGAVLYFRVYFLGMPALAMYNFGNAVLSAVGDTKRPLYYLSFSGVLNVILNLIFVIVFDMGVAGVALASAISQNVSAGLIIWTLLRSTGDYSLRLGALRISGDIAGNLLRIGIPSSIQYAIFQFANLFVQIGVNSFDTVIVEGTAAASNADGLVYEMMAAFYTAGATFIGQNFGAGKKERIVKSYFISTLYALVLALVLGLGLVVCGRPFLHIFTQDEAVVEAGMYRLTVMGLSYWVSAFMDSAIAASRGLGQTTVPTVIVIMGSCVFRLVWIYTVFAFFGTITSLYLLYVFSWTITAIAEIWYFVRLYRRTCAIFPAAASRDS